MPERRGVLAQWDDERGFGFITPTEGGPRVFAHVSAFPRGRRPAAGTEVTYAEGRDERGRPRAKSVAYLVEPRATAGPGTGPALVAMALFFALLIGLVATGGLHVAVLAPYALMSALSFGVYAQDKTAARQGRRRVPESTLHLLDLACGWPGGLVARRALRHKTRKQPFRTVFWLTVIVNCAVLGWFVLDMPMPSAELEDLVFG